MGLCMLYGVVAPPSVALASKRALCMPCLVVAPSSLVLPSEKTPHALLGCYISLHCLGKEGVLHALICDDV